MDPAAPQLPGKRSGVVGAFLHAWDGLIHTTAHQRNMKFHVFSATLVACVGAGIPLGLSEKVSLVFCVLLVFFAEIMNTSLEALVDLHTESFHQLAKVAKDTAAAGVLVLAIGTLVIFAAILVHDWNIVVRHPEEVLRQLAVGGPMSLLGALLPWKRPRPKLADVLIFLAALALWTLTASWTHSAVFSAMLLCLLVMQAGAAWSLRWR